MIAEVIINSNAKKLNRKFDYKVPADLEDIITVGSRVLIPFANFKKLEEGYVIKIKNSSNYEVKEIVGLEESLSKDRIELARWMARKYFCNVSECIKLMLTPGTRNKDKEKRISDKTMEFIYLTENFEIDSLRGEKQKRAMTFIIKNEGCTVSEIKEFTDCSRSTINSLIEKGFIEIHSKKVDRNPLVYKDEKENNKLQLNDEQSKSFETIKATIKNKKFEEFLLYGITGSGKTEVYLQLIEEVINKDRSAIVLVPEISLTPQMLDRFIGRFGKEKIAVLHSRLSIGERHDEWIRIKENRAKIIIGARSAIFAPVNDLGIIIIDEEHDASYKSDSTPRYNAKEVAEKIAINKNIPLVLGSATPDIRTFYRTQVETAKLQNINTKLNKITLLELRKRANNSNLPDVEIIDLKYELATGNKSMISHALYDAMDKNIKNNKQTILFLNRRGYSTFIMCRECGYTVKCPNCNISLTYHKYKNILKCHYCGHEEKPVSTCPSCGSDKIRYFGTGTQKLEQEINKIFPKAKTIRMDVDTVTKKNSYEDILDKFKNDNIDILIGTQMVVKGHHFPNVTLVGVIAADGSLNIDDYRSNERTFQLLTQVAGRAGREKNEGKVIIQTYNPDSFPIEYAQKQDYDLFYNTEINLRKQLKYPPFCDIIVVGFTGENEDEIKKVSENVYEMLKINLEKYGINIYKPMPAPIDKIQKKYRWRIIAKGIANDDVNVIINKCLQRIYQENYTKTKIAVDINPNNMM